jgi:vitamin K-dependent gamma-carboxylase
VTTTKSEDSPLLTRDVASLAVFRIGFGLMMAIGALRFMAEGWIDPFFVEPSFFFKYTGFSWVTPLSRTGMYAVYCGIALSATFIALGLFYRGALSVFTLLFAYVQLCDVTNYLNHYYLVVLVGFLLFFIPAHHAFSLDALRKPRSPTAPALALFALRFQFALVYFYAGLAKVNAEWLLEAQPLRVWFLARDGLPLIGPLLSKTWVAYLASWGACFYDLTIPLWLSWRRTRKLAFLAVLGFHGMTSVFFDIGLFPFIMTLGATLFFDPSWPRRFLRAPGLTLHQPHRTAPALRIVFAVYALVQLTLPLRHYLYRGDVLWDERGMRFSWKVMVREKSGSVTYVVTTNDRTFLVSAHDYLTWRQANEMSAQPDLILQLARHIAADLKTKGLAVTEVRADVVASLNAKPPERLIDPAANLLLATDTSFILRRHK